MHASKTQTLRLNTAARKAGATKVQRNGARSFTVGYLLVEGSSDQPGRGPAVVAALEAALPSATVRWGGTQADAIHVTVT